MGLLSHKNVDFYKTKNNSLERILAFVPIFAPLLFCDYDILEVLVVSREREEK